MGTLIYGPAAREINIDDRMLAHLEVVIIAKLRRGESFAFHWDRPTTVGSGHSTIWIHPALFLEFSFSGSRRIHPNRAWIDALMAEANGSHGLGIIPEPDIAG